MAAKRKRRSMPHMLFWSKAEQRRFIDAVERFQSLVHDMEAVLAPKKRQRKLKEPQPNGTPEQGA